MSIFKDVQLAPTDAILGLATAFKEDAFKQKANLGVGAYRTEAGKPWPLPSVKTAELQVVNDPALDKEYVPIDGLPNHKKPVQELIFSAAEIESGRVATAQTLSGTGSLQMIGQFLKGVLHTKAIHVPNPTWGNHPAIFARAGLECKKYTYYKPETRGFDFDGMMKALNEIPAGDAVLLHACAQNPTGVDPTDEQWKAIVECVKARRVIPVIDNAYQGYATGSLEKDNTAQKLFENSGLQYFIAQSFAKNFGLYGERVGYVHVRCSTKDEANSVLSQIKILIRQAYSSPPRHGAAIVNKILSDAALKKQWLEELTLMSNRVVQMRTALRSAIEKKGTPGTWNHITDQIGMFSFTGLEIPQSERMVKEFHIYMTKDGRISMAGLNPSNVDYVAASIDAVVRGNPAAKL